MDEKKLNEKESLELITKMIQNTKQNFKKGDGNTFIIWGVSTLFTACLITLLLFSTNNVAVNWLWFLIPIIGWSWMLSVKKEQQLVTYVDRIIQKTWIMIVVIAVLIPILLSVFIFLKQDFWISKDSVYRLVPFLEILICSIALAFTGITLDFKPIQRGGGVGIVLSFLCLLNISWIALLIFAVWAIACMIIPGIKLNSYIRKNKDHV